MLSLVLGCLVYLACPQDPEPDPATAQEVSSALPQFLPEGTKAFQLAPVARDLTLVIPYEMSQTDPTQAIWGNATGVIQLGAIAPGSDHKSFFEGMFSQLSGALEDTPEITSVPTKDGVLGWESRLRIRSEDDLPGILWLLLTEVKDAPSYVLFLQGPIADSTESAKPVTSAFFNRLPPAVELQDSTVSFVIEEVPVELPLPYTWFQFDSMWRNPTQTLERFGFKTDVSNLDLKYNGTLTLGLLPQHSLKEVAQYFEALKSQIAAQADNVESVSIEVSDDGAKITTRVRFKGESPFGASQEYWQCSLIKAHGDSLVMLTGSVQATMHHPEPLQEKAQEALDECYTRWSNG